MLIQVVQGDITKERVDAIACSTNQFLVFKSGVSLALLTSGGSQIRDEADDVLRRRIQSPTGSVAHTSAGDLDAKHLLHVVGPHNGPSQLGLD